MRLLASTDTLVGGGIVAPVYYVATSTTHTKLTKFISELAKDKLQTPEVAVKVSCIVSTFSTEAPANSEFLKEQGKDVELYKPVTCSEVVRSNGDKSLLGGNWEALFPKDVLTKIFSLARESGTVEMNVKSFSSRDTFSTFSNIEGTSSIKARWARIVDTTYFSETKTVEALIEENSHKSKVIYLLLEPPTK